MSVPKPTGEYADDMLDPGGWPEVDEQSLYDRGQTLTNTLQQVTTAIEGFQHEETEIFGGGIWSGGGANSAQGKLGEVVSDLQGVQNDLVKAITWYQKAADTVAQTKSAIADRVQQAQSKISDLEDDTDSDPDDIQDEIDSLVQQVHGDNVGDVTGAAAKVPTSASWKPPADALKNLLEQKAPPNTVAPHPGGPGIPGAPGGHQAGRGGDPAGFNGQPVMAVPGGPGTTGGAGSPGGPGGHQAGRGGDPAGFNGQPVMPVPGGPGGHQPGRGGDPGAFGDPGLGPAPGLTPPPGRGPGAPPNFSIPSLSGLSGPGGSSGGLGTPMSSLMSGGFGGQAQPSPLGGLDAKALDGLKTADAGQAGQGMAQPPSTNAPIAAAAQAAASAAAANAAMVAPAAAQGPPVTSEAQAAVVAGGSAAGGVGSVGGGIGHGGGAGIGGGGMSASPEMSGAGAGAASMPLLPPATPHPAAPVSAAGGGGTPGASASGSGGPGVHPASTTSVGRAGLGGSVTSSQPEAAPAPIPVSSARAQKDAIAGATRRQTSGDVQVAYRLGAALNAEDVVNKGDYNFFWMTSVTADGRIVVANSYGLGYIPDGVNLPAQVIMASADEVIPVEERARWATYPNLALQGWAAHHDTTLRTVIAKQEHFKGIDPGVPKHFVADEDVPASGRMQGRSRLEVIAPGEAARLAVTSDLGLVELLPPAPVDDSAPADQRNTLWFEAWKHLMRSDVERGVGHLRAFAAYATHCQELALYRAHTAVHAVEQRAAVADWMYWRRVAALIDHALGGFVHP